MKTFKQFLKETAMTYDEAVKILDIKDSTIDLTTAWKMASKKHHPDLGGSTDMMQKVNAAYSLLKKIGTKHILSPDERKRDDDMKLAKAKMELAVIKNALNKDFSVERFSKHFSKFFPGLLKHTVKEKIADSYWTGAYVQQIHEWATTNRETIFYYQIYFSAEGNQMNKMLGGGDSGLQWKITIDNYLYHDNRKQKMKQRTWDWKGSTTEVSDPENIFPSKVLKKVFEGKKERKFKRRDFESGFLRKLGDVTFDREGSWIDLGEEDGKKLKLYIYRMSMGKDYSAWMVNGIYKAGSRVKMGYVVSVEETEETMNMWIDIVKRMRAAKGVEAMNSVITKELEKYKIERDKRLAKIGKI